MAGDNGDRIVRLLGEMSGPVTLDAADMRLLVELARKPASEGSTAAQTPTKKRDIGRWIGEILKDKGFPEGRRGDIGGHNGLFRPNWFNGRYLTAEALEAQDVYWDQRTRAVARVFPAGISWGLGLETAAATTEPYPEKGAAAPGHPVATGVLGGDEVVTLTPGEGFDGIGRPIVVGAPFRFCFNDLIRRYAARPTRVAPSATAFAPCICLEPDDGGPRPTGSAILPGPYLLCIEPQETPEGEAARYGELCGHERSLHCEADGWRGGFGLTLARFPVTLPGVEEIRSAFDLRGVLSAYYFGVFEQDLVRRWDRPFGRDRRFCDPTGPCDRYAGCLPLAMVYVAVDGRLVFLDPWIPRRPLAATGARISLRTAFGAPADPAAFARMRQFQCMLADSIAEASPDWVDPSAPLPPNLCERGFRNIPPVGVLPVHPINILDDKLTAIDGRGALAGVLSGSVEAALVYGMRLATETYFRGTTVVPYYTVALHDDDVLEDIGNAFDKDPIVVRRQDDAGRDRIEAIYDSLRDAAGSANATLAVSPLTAFAALLGTRVAKLVAQMDRLVNRRVELVKVVIPLQGLVRPHPVLGETAADAAGELETLIREVFGQQIGPISITDLIAGLSDGAARRTLPTTMPRGFVVYVKQRLVVLDLLYLMLALLTGTRGKTSVLFSAVTGREATAAAATGFGPRDVFASDSERRMLAAALALPEVRRIVVESAVLASPDLTDPGLWKRYTDAVDARTAELVPNAASPETARAMARVEVAEAFALDRPGFEPIAALALILDGETTERVLADAERVATGPLADYRAMPRERLIDQVTGAAPIFTEARSRAIYAALRRGMDSRPATDLAPGTAGGTTVGEVLALPPGAAAARLGGDQARDLFLREAKTATEGAREAAEALGTAPLDPRLRDHYATLVGAGADPGEALAKTTGAFRDTDGLKTVSRQIERALALVSDGERARLAGALLRDGAPSFG